MNRILSKEILDRISRRTGYENIEIENIVFALFDEIENLANEHPNRKVTLPRFGSFRVVSALYKWTKHKLSIDITTKKIVFDSNRALKRRLIKRFGTKQKTTKVFYYGGNRWGIRELAWHLNISAQTIRARLKAGDTIRDLIESFRPDHLDPHKMRYKKRKKKLWPVPTVTLDDGQELSVWDAAQKFNLDPHKLFYLTQIDKMDFENAVKICQKNN